MNEIACTLDTDSLATRRERWVALGSRALTGIEKTPQGLRLVFEAAPGVRTELDELAALERDCCRFATWTVGGAGPRVVLDVAAEREEAVGAVQELFGTLRRLVATGG